MTTMRAGLALGLALSSPFSPQWALQAYPVHSPRPASSLLGCANLNRAFRPPRSSKLRMDDEVARKGIREELTTRDEYLENRFYKLSESGYDLTPMTSKEVEEAAQALPLEQRTALLEGTACQELDSQFRDHRQKGMYTCAIGGLPVFTSGVKLDSVRELASFSEPCDPEHVVEEASLEEGTWGISCARSGVRLGTASLDPTSPSGKRYSVLGSAVVFHTLGKPLPVASQPENYWGSEGQYRAWTIQ